MPKRLVPKDNAFLAHTLDDDQALQIVTFRSEGFSPVKEAFFDADADALRLCATLLCNIKKSPQDVPVRKEVVDKQQLVIFHDVFLAHPDGILEPLRIREHLGRVNFPIQVLAVHLLGEDSRHFELLGSQDRNRDSARFEVQDLRDLLIPEEPVELLAHIAKQFYIEHMVQEIIHLQDVPIPDFPILQDLVF